VRMVTESDLSREQREICYAPPTGTILVIGPPGSGKTVVALHRAHGLAQQELEHQVLVFNHVLRKYTGDGSTFYKWLAGWWRRCTGRLFPSTRVHGGPYSNRFDFGSAIDQLRANVDHFTNGGNWGHLILDEAQDFPREAHVLLSLVQQHLDSASKKSSLMILADENQRITDANSTIKDIAMTHFLSSEDKYELKRNYRNTLEIARFSGSFYAGLPSGKPELPDRRGSLPTIVRTNGIDSFVDRIATWSMSHDDQEIGILVYYNKTRKKLFNKLMHRLSGTGIRVQTYTSTRDDPNNDPAKLVFDEGGVVTVICFASSKGLEFDTVFLPELQSMPVDFENRDGARMQLYVMSSRARRDLFLGITDPGQNADIWQILPEDESLYRME